jgi:chromodomain-helicase-DNA-binding protein 1
MSWDEIIPLDEWQKLEFEEEERQLEESATNDPRKRSHAQVSYEGMDID